MKSVRLAPSRALPLGASTFRCVFALLTALAAPIAQATSDIVISQVYGGGGNTGATFTNDFIELFNRGSATINLNGWSVQYASSTGTTWNGKTNLSGILAPGQYLLVQQAAGTGGTTALPTPDVIGTIAMSGTTGKVALVNSTTQIATGIACPNATNGVVDFVGYGAANCFEGAASTATLTNSTAALRAAAGCTDTDNNNTDFSTGAPTPRNLATTAAPCNGTTVSIAATDASASEIGSDPGTFTLSRAGNTLSQPLTVTYTVSGTATPGSDYTPILTGTHTFAANQTSTPLTITPIDDSAVEPNETVIVTVDSSIDYSISGSSSATVTIADSDSPDTAPAVVSTTPANGATNVPPNTNVTVTFSEPVNLAAGAISLQCPGGSATLASNAAQNNVTTVFLTPAVPLLPNASCQIQINAASVADVDSNDPPDLMAATVNASFTVAATACAAADTPIGQIQGSGSSFALSGTRTVQGVVVGDYEYPGSGNTGDYLRGFYLQNPAADADGNAATSDAIFVFNSSANSVSVGQVVQVTGTVSEWGFTNGSGETQTQISATAIEQCGATGTVPITDINLPLPAAVGGVPNLERYEGMLVRFAQPLTVTEHFQLGRFGQVTLSGSGRLPQPTNVTTPGSAALAQQASNDLNLIVLDDSNEFQNADPIVFGRGGAPLSASNTLRGGDTITGIVGVLTHTDATWYSFVPADSDPVRYRVRPLNALNGVLPNFQPINPRPAVPLSASGRIRVAGFNLLNYFNTFGLGACTNGVGGTATDCRGAENTTEFNRQAAKTVQAAIGTAADVLVINEIENDGYGATSAIQDIVNRLNTATAPGTYAFINVDANTGAVNALGIDAIKVGMIYKPAKVTPVGTTAVANTGAFGLFTTTGGTIQRSRPALAQAFQEIATGQRLIVVGNHLKSKGSACADNISPVGPDPDALDGQGNCNLTRTAAAAQLVSWLAGNPTGTGDADILIMGDLNSYAKEDPITTLVNGGYTNLIADRLGPQAYSYVFDGQWGYLDHALGSASVLPQVVSVSEWHINADEPNVLDYNTNFKSAGQITSLYAADAFRTSDHDPVVVGLNLAADTDGDGLTDDIEALIGSSPTDADSDDDGISDGNEDLNHNGVVDSGETSPTDADSDNDGLQDGTETGVTTGVADPDGSGPLLGTNTGVFIADANPLTTTLPLDSDTDNDGALDGVEDANHNGALDVGEFDPNNANSVPPGSAARQVPATPWWVLLIGAIGMLAAVCTGRYSVRH